jgi:hypothetical protein
MKGEHCLQGRKNQGQVSSDLLVVEIELFSLVALFDYFIFSM